MLIISISPECINLITLINSHHFSPFLCVSGHLSQASDVLGPHSSSSSNYSWFRAYKSVLKITEQAGWALRGICDQNRVLVWAWKKTGYFLTVKNRQKKRIFLDSWRLLQNYLEGPYFLRCLEQFWIILSWRMNSLIHTSFPDFISLYPVDTWEMMVWSIDYGLGIS